MVRLRRNSRSPNPHLLTIHFHSTMVRLRLQQWKNLVQQACNFLSIPQWFDWDSPSPPFMNEARNGMFLFPFHNGSIETLGQKALTPYFTQTNFHSTMVRLRLGITTSGLYWKLHKASERFRDFHSTMVRLRPQRTVHIPSEILDFHSTMVRLRLLLLHCAVEQL
jgi:hypothetical protein